VREAARIELPVAHGEGNFRARDAATMAELAAAGRIVARYVDARGRPCGFPVNPNGSQGEVAGLCDATGRVFALMPHPERHFLPTHHPRWTRRQEQPEHGDGRIFFVNAVRHFA
jgi:phosphoribosylformylglycinamidine synthase subunit PurQ / glutaminase